MPFREEKKIKIGLVISSNLRQWAGMEHVVFEYWRRAPADVDVTIFQNDYNPNPRLSQEEFDNLFHGANIKIFRGYFQKLAFFDSSMFGKIVNNIIFRPFLAILLKFTVLRKLRKERRDLDIFYFFNPDVEPKIIGRKKGKLIGSTHAWFPSDSNLFKRLELKLVENGIFMANLDYFHFFPSQYAMLSQASKERFFSLPIGVDSEKYFPSDIEKNRTIKFLFNARIEECKGVLRVIEAFEALKANRHICLEIVGSGSLSDIVKNMADNQIKYHGFVSEEELYKIITHCDILVYPSVCDSFPAVVLNSLSAGLHVIVTERISENFKPFLDAGFVTVTDIEKNTLVIAMQKCIDNIEEIRKNRVLCHNIAVANYDWSCVTSEFYQKIKSIFYNEYPNIVRDEFYNEAI